MGILSKLLGTGEIIKEGFELIDDMHTSTEEEIQAKSKAKTDLLNAYAPFKVAQRYLALMFAFTFLTCFAAVILLSIGDHGNVETIRAVMGEFYIAEIMFTIIAFYFGGGMFEGMLNARKS